MLTYKSYYNIVPPYLCELINKKESHVNTRLGREHIIPVKTTYKLLKIHNRIIYKIDPYI